MGGEYTSVIGIDLPSSCVLNGTAQMTDAEFWEHVYGGDRPEPDYEPPDDIGAPGYPQPCPVCNATAACGYDQDGRPMIHAIDTDLEN